VSLEKGASPALEAQRPSDASLIPINPRNMVTLLEQFGTDLSQRVTDDVIERLAKELINPM